MKCKQTAWFLKKKKEKKKICYKYWTNKSGNKSNL